MTTTPAPAPECALAYEQAMAELFLDVVPVDRAITEVVDHLRSRLPEGAAVLELGCGHGRILHALAGAGFRCVGIEQSPYLAGLAVEEGGQLGDRRPTVICGDALDLDALDAYDAVVIAGATFTLLPVEGRATLLEACARALRPGGWLFVDGHHPDAIRAAHGGGTMRCTYPDRRRGSVVAESTLTGDEWRTTYRDEAGEGAVLGQETHHLVAPANLVRLAADHGLHVERVLPWWSRVEASAREVGFVCELRAR